MSIPSSLAENQEELYETIKNWFGIDTNNYPDCLFELRDTLQKSKLLVCISPNKIKSFSVEPHSYKFGDVSNMHYYYFKTLAENSYVR